MATHSHVGRSLDELARLSADGDAVAEQELFERLRVRFLSIAKRRVRADDLEDVVQDALRTVHGKYGQRQAAPTMLTWSLAVLRNVIGNYYQRRQRRNGAEAFDEQRHVSVESAAAQAVVAGEETVAEALEAIARLARTDARCAIMFRRILESLELGGVPAEVSRRAMASMRAEFGDVSRGALYVALHRCRRRLREILRDMQALDV